MRTEWKSALQANFAGKFTVIYRTTSYKYSISSFKNLNMKWWIKVYIWKTKNELIIHLLLFQSRRKLIKFYDIYRTHFLSFSGLCHNFLNFNFKLKGKWQHWTNETSFYTLLSSTWYSTIFGSKVEIKLCPDMTLQTITKSKR